MGVITTKKRKLEKKYEDILSFDELLSDVKEFEKKLASMKEGIKEFDQEFSIVKEKTQRKIREF